MASYALLAGVSLRAFPVFKTKAAALRALGPSHRDAGRVLGMLVAAATVTGWHKRYYASHPALFAALVAQLAGAGAWLAAGGRANGKAFDPMRTLVGPAVGRVFAAWVGGIATLIGGGRGLPGDGAAVKKTS